MSNFYEKELEFSGLNLLVRQICSKPAIESHGMDENHHGITPKPTMKSSGINENDQNATPKRTTSRGPHEEEFISQLAGRLKGLIRQAVAEVKQKSQAFIKSQAANNEVVRVMPISYHMPRDYDHSILPMSEKKRQKTIMVGEIQISFELPEEYTSHGSKLDKVPMLPHLIRKIKPGVKHNVALKFLERLKGWKLQCRQRNDGKLDVYFHHLKSNEAFRSIIEVENFILHEICPRHLKRATKAPNENFLGSNRDGRGKSTKKHSTIGVSEVEEKVVKDNFDKFDNENSPQRSTTCSDKHITNTESSTASSEATVEDIFHSEYIQGTKRKRTEYSSSATSRRRDKCIAISSDLFTTASSVDADHVSSVANLEAHERDKMVSTSKPDQLVDMPKASHNPYQYDLATHLFNLKYRRFGGDDFF